jgi:hypothetical protein
MAHLTVSHIFFPSTFIENTNYSWLMDHKDKKEQPTHLVTSVGQSLSIDQSARQKRYFISMMIRTVCFIAAVIAANAGRETIKGGAVYAGKYKELN